MCTNSPNQHQSQRQSHTISSKSAALSIVNLHSNATRREIVLQYRKLVARLYHPDKWYIERDFSYAQGIEIFKKIADAKNYLLN